MDCNTAEMVVRSHFADLFDKTCLGFSRLTMEPGCCFQTGKPIGALVTTIKICWKNTTSIWIIPMTFNINIMREHANVAINIDTQIFCSPVIGWVFASRVKLLPMIFVACIWDMYVRSFGLPNCSTGINISLYQDQISPWVTRHLKVMHLQLQSMICAESDRTWFNHLFCRSVNLHADFITIFTNVI